MPYFLGFLRPHFAAFSFPVPVHKVDDISHVNFTDRDHLWFDPNWKSTATAVSSNGTGRRTNNNAGEDDPMAAMLENNAKNTNATNIFVNKLHGLVSEYAEVNHANVMPSTENNRISTTNGPYATTTLIEPSNVSSTKLPPFLWQRAYLGTSAKNARNSAVAQK